MIYLHKILPAFLLPTGVTLLLVLVELVSRRRRCTPGRAKRGCVVRDSRASRGVEPLWASVPGAVPTGRERDWEVLSRHTEGRRTRPYWSLSGCSGASASMSCMRTRRWRRCSAESPRSPPARHWWFTRRTDSTFTTRCRRRSDEPLYFWNASAVG